MAKSYKNPPIIEVLCELRFDPSSQWDLAIPGLLFAKVKSQFPVRRQARAAVGTTVSVRQDVVEQEIRVSDKSQFLRGDERAVVQVGHNVLVVNHLKPYPSWEKFMPLIKFSLDAYREVAEPKAIERIGLRYINRIEMASRSVEMEDYFEFRPFVGSALPQTFGPFIVGIGVPYEQGRDQLRLELTSVKPEQEDAVAATLDLDYFLARRGRVELSGVADWLEVAHEHITEVFEGCLTDKLRLMFDKETR